MRWTERQRAMLREMGLEVWAPPAAPAERPEPRAATSDPSPRAVPVPPSPLSVPARPSPTPAPTAARPGVATPAPAPASAPAAAEPAPRPDRDLIATLDWPALREAVANCRACALHASRRQTVFGVGHERAHWMIVGEAPGEQEDLKGEPFVGPAGRLLDAMLAALDLTREPDTPERQVYIANTVKCRPPGNRNPQPEEMARCEPFLVRQIRLVQPRIIVAMGRFAVQALLRTGDAIGRLRRRVHEYEGVPLVVTYHPAYLLRQPADKAKAWDDLCLAAQVLDNRRGRDAP